MNHFHFQSHSLHHQQYIENVDNIGKVMMIKLSPFFAPMIMMIVTVMMMMAKGPFFFLACPPYTETPLSLHLFHSHKLFCPLTQFGRTISLFLAPSSKLRGEFTLTILNKALSVPFLVSSFWDYLWSKIPIKRVSVTWIILGQILSALEQSEGLQNYDPQFSKHYCAQQLTLHSRTARGKIQLLGRFESLLLGCICHIHKYKSILGCQ